MKNPSYNTCAIEKDYPETLAVLLDIGSPGIFSVFRSSCHMNLLHSVSSTTCFEFSSIHQTCILNTKWKEAFPAFKQHYM